MAFDDFTSAKIRFFVRIPKFILVNMYGIPKFILQNTYEIPEFVLPRLRKKEDVASIYWLKLKRHNENS